MALTRRPKRRPTGPDADTRALVLTRSQGRCERCGDPLVHGVQIHHRRPRGAGGTRREDTNSPANLLALCVHPGRACHDLIESLRDRARELGYLLRQGEDPALVPLLLHGQRWVRLDHRGGYVLVSRVADDTRQSTLGA